MSHEYVSNRPVCHLFYVVTCFMSPVLEGGRRLPLSKTEALRGITGGTMLLRGLYSIRHRS
jgi:hypothetical protein